MRRNFIYFLAAELIVIGLVLLIFRFIEPRILAGATAGSVFVALGLYIFVSGVRNVEVRRSLTFVVGSIHLFVVALPLMITRFLNSSLVFEDVRVLGLPGPVFHQVSSYVYLALIVATVIDIIRTKIKMTT